MTRANWQVRYPILAADYPPSGCFPTVLTCAAVCAVCAEGQGGVHTAARGKQVDRILAEVAEAADAAAGGD